MIKNKKETEQTAAAKPAKEKKAISDKELNNASGGTVPQRRGPPARS